MKFKLTVPLSITFVIDFEIVILVVIRGVLAPFGKDYWLLLREALVKTLEPNSIRSPVTF